MHNNITAKTLRFAWTHNERPGIMMMMMMMMTTMTNMLHTNNIFNECNSFTVVAEFNLH